MGSKMAEKIINEYLTISELDGSWAESFILRSEMPAPETLADWNPASQAN